MFRRIALAVALLAGAATANAARTHAVLVGVSAYPSLDKTAQLQGPRNDVRMFLELLLNRGVARQDIKIVADGIKDGVLPTRRAILGALSDVATRVAAGDFVFVFIGGHGSQQPAALEASEEPDGFDEIFLPRDIGRWDGAAGAVENAITDDEFGVAIARLRGKGAFVWAVFDTCHSGTLSRAIPLPERRDRQVAPESLGIDAVTLTKALGRATHARHQVTAKRAGQDVAMYAAQSFETTPEYAQPEGTPGAVARGLFSYTLYQVLTANPDITYRQVMERVSQKYLARGIEYPSPNYEGTGLDAIVFGGRSGVRRLQWRIDRKDKSLELRAGVINETATGSILAVVPSPAAADNELIGYVKVTQARAASADVVPVAFAGRAPFNTTLIGSSAYARPVELKFDTRLRVGMPAKTERCELANPVVLQAIERVRQGGDSNSRLQWVGSSEPADVRLCQRGTQLLFLDRSANIGDGSLRSHHGISVPPSPLSGDSAASVATELRAQLLKVARVINLARVSSGSFQAVSQAEITVTRQRQCPPAAPDCRSTTEPVLPNARPDLRGGDRFSVTIANPLLQPIDVTILYVDAAYGIAPLYPEPGVTPRIEPEGRLQRTFTVNPLPSGFERMIVITVPATPQSPSMDFTSLAQTGLPEGATRGSSANVTAATPSVVTYLWNVLPSESNPESTP
ncbi:MAG: caspase family protein [Steroidobacter sp.]|nr:caspase family protein [Steroidobacter sp.]